MSFSFNKPAVTETKPEDNNPALTPELTNSASEGETMKAKAVAFASRESDVMSDVIETVMKAKEDWQGGPIRVLAALQATYGEELASWPQPDDETSNNPDKFKIEVTNSKGKASMANTSFYAEFAAATKEGKAIEVELAFLSRASNNEAIKDGIPQNILDMNPQEREKRENFLKGRKSTIKASYKKAMALGFQLIAVNSLPGMVADFLYDDDAQTQVSNTTKPIVIYQEPPAGKPVSKYEHFSIGSFCKLNVNKARELGGNLAALKKTVERNTDGGATGNNGKATEVPAIATVETFVERFVDTFRFMDQMQRDKTQKDIGALYKVLKAKDNDELIVAVVEYSEYLNDIRKELKLDAKYTAIQTKDPELTKTAA